MDSEEGCRIAVEKTDGGANGEELGRHSCEVGAGLYIEAVEHYALCAFATILSHYMSMS